MQVAALKEGYFISSTIPFLMHFALTPFVYVLGRVVPVPGMGDSISEGVVEEFVKGMFLYLLYLHCFAVFL